jgi:hypothetical protein
MSQGKWKRLHILQRLVARKLTMGAGSVLLRLSVRQMRRLRRRYEAEGVSAVEHGNKGRCPPNRLPANTRKRVVALARGKYAGFNDVHLTEKLVGEEQVAVSRETVRKLLRAAGIGAVRKRRPAQHRKRRERKAQAGMMLLWDGSRHAWLEERGPLLCLMAAIDDATGEVMPGAHILEQESAAGYLRVLRDVAREKGLPLSIYMDRHGSLKRNDDHWSLEEQLRGKQDPTQVGRALRRAVVGDASRSPRLRAAAARDHDGGRSKRGTARAARGAQQALLRGGARE